MAHFLEGMLSAITMALDWPIAVWPISLALCAAATWALLALVKRKQLGSKIVLLATALSVAFFIGIAAFTAAFWADPAYPAPAPQLRHAAILGYVWWAYFLVMVLLVGLAKGMRLSLTALAALLVWINFGIVLIGTMAVEGNWI